jgi:cell division protein FtsI (penicillin-binding protein 3)
MVVPMLEAVVSDEGTGFLARVPGYRVAGKTGTSTKIDTVAGGYSNDRYSASFAGFLPAEAPRVVIAVALDEPMKMHHGGEVAAPVFARIGEVAMRAMGVVPSAVVPQVAARDGKTPIPESTDAPVLASTADIAVESGKVPSFIGLTAREAMDRYSGLQLHAELQLEGSGRVVRQSPEAGTPDNSNERLHLVLTNQGND